MLQLQSRNPQSHIINFLEKNVILIVLVNPFFNVNARIESLSYRFATSLTVLRVKNWVHGYINRSRLATQFFPFNAS